MCHKCLSSLSFSSVSHSARCISFLFFSAKKTGAILTNFAKCHSCNHHFLSYEIRRFSSSATFSPSPYIVYTYSGLFAALNRVYFQVVLPTCYEFCRCQRDRRHDFQFPHSYVISASQPPRLFTRKSERI